MSSSSKNLTKTLKSLEGLHFLPLGGSGEIGMNANFYFCDGQWIMIDNGITFSRVPDSVLMTDIRAFIETIDRKSLQGLVITHAHEDHVGAAAYLWPYLKCPLYATPFTAYILRQKLKEVGLEKVPVTEVPLEGSIQLGVFDIEFVSLTHSVPEPNGLFIKTPKGNIFHTGDWKIDPTPLIGNSIDHEKLIGYGNKGVLALVCDSTNIFEEGKSGSEEEVRVTIEELVAECEGRVFISCFSSNLARIQSCYQAAVKAGRKVCLIGRSLERMVAAARHCGYLDNAISFIAPEDLKLYAPSQILIISTGSQAEPGAALTRMSRNSHPFVTFTPSDTIIFSSRMIPGNQEAIAGLQNRLVMQGVNMVTYKEGLHVSGHPCRGELAQMYEWLKPQILIPVHGEDMHIKEHALFGKEQGIPQTIRPHNGQLFCLSAEKVVHVEDVPTGRLALDGRRLIESEGPVLRQRKQLLEKGIVSIHLSIARATSRILNKSFIHYGIFEDDDERKEWEDVMESKINDIFSQISTGRSSPEKGAAPVKSGQSSKEIREMGIACEKEIRHTFRKRMGIDPIVKISAGWV